jgi:phosphoglycerol geranylgeranyltransferase
MTDAEWTVADFICDRTQPTRHAILIDPAGQSPEVAAKRAIAAVNAGSQMILVGGSSDTDGANVNTTVLAIKEGLELVLWASSQDSVAGGGNWKAPVVLFPQGSSALSPAADAITFMMLMNSTDPRFLIGEQTLGAPFVKKANIKPIPMGYVICEPGGKAGEVGKADLVLSSETDRVAALAMAAECFGFSLFYLEAGSGAATPVDPKLIRTARASCNLTLVVGGGIRDGKAARTAAEAGADWIITGNIAEEFDDADELQRTLAALIEGMNA